MRKYTKEDIKDKDWQIRLAAYRKLGFTEDALKDKRWEVRLAAKEYFDSNTRLETELFILA